MRFSATLPVFLAVSACAAASPPDSSEPSGGVCQNEALSQFIGQRASAQLGGEMLRVSGARVIRWVPLGGAVTMDFSPARLTVQLDGANRVQSPNCG